MEGKKTQEPLGKAKTEHFVNYYLSQESLWNISHKSYSKRDIRQAAMSMIAQQMQESCGRVMTVEQVSAKIASLRTYYGRELKKVNSSQKSGAATSDVYVSQWEFFQLLDPFLRSQVQKRSSVSNMTVTDKDVPEEAETTDLMAGSTSSTPRTSADPTPQSTSEKNCDMSSPTATPLKKRRQGADKDVDVNRLIIHTLSQISERKKEKNDSDSDSDLLFGKQVGLEMKKILDLRKRQELKLKIQSLIFSYQFESEP